MLLVRYFLYVGGVLVVLLLATSAFAPKPEVVSTADSGFDRSVIRIHSEQKLPARVVFDTTAPAATIAAVPAAPIVASAPPAPANANIAMISPTARVRETFAQFVPAEPKKPQLKAKAVKSRVASPRMRFAEPRTRFAEHERFGFDPRLGFAANNIW
jgi:hypothetical protein